MTSKVILFGVAASLLFSFCACKPKQSAYKAAYDAAKAKELQELQTRTVEDVPAVAKANDSFQTEKLKVVEGSALRPYSVVIGSFINRTNAVSLKERMEKAGYQPALAQNEKGMYRVIVATFDTRTSAIEAREKIRSKYAPEFEDAWLLLQE